LAFTLSAICYKHIVLNIYQYITLCQDKKYRYLLQNGTCIGNRDMEESCILLFQLSDFYVEVYFNKTSGSIIRNRCFQSTDELLPYIEHIDLSNLVWSSINIDVFCLWSLLYNNSLMSWHKFWISVQRIVCLLVFRWFNLCPMRYLTNIYPQTISSNKISSRHLYYIQARKRQHIISKKRMLRCLLSQ
jgi:hypothetical protein